MGGIFSSETISLSQGDLSGKISSADIDLAKLSKLSQLS